MALNEIGIHFYEKEIDRLLDSEDREIIIGKFVDLQSTIDDLYVELQDRARRISELETELAKKETLLRIKEEFCEACKEQSLIEKLKETPIVEEPLPFSSDEYEEETKTELPVMPIDVASMLINARRGFADKYSKDDLQEIIKHLTAFCENPSDD